MHLNFVADFQFVVELRDWLSVHEHSPAIQPLLHFGARPTVKELGEKRE
jgi:hypothetical protein